MKIILLSAAICASVMLPGCAELPPSATAATTDAGSTHSAGVDAPAATNATPVPSSYGTNKETYAHASSDVSISALIAGGATSGGPAVAPSATVIEGRLREWHLLPSDIAAEMNQGGPVVRTKVSSSSELTQSKDDDALLTLVNNRLVADADTGRITTRLKVSNGEVTIHGSAGSAGLIGRAIAIALDTPGVVKVTSDLQIDPRLPAALR